MDAMCHRISQWKPSSGMYTLIETVRRNGGEALIAGDFNAKSAEWGSPITDHRGQYLQEACASLDLIVQNTGGQPTFVRGASKSYIDLTFTTQNLSRMVTDWRVLENEPLTLHKHIVYRIREANVPKHVTRVKSSLNTAELRRILRDETIEIPDDPKGLSDTLKDIYRRASVKSNEGGVRNLPYWWTEEIDNARRACIQARRRATRARGAAGGDYEELERQYKERKKDLKKMIRAEKKKQWMTLCDELNDDIWGQGYAIAMRHFKGQTPPYRPDEDKMEAIIRALFHEHEERAPLPHVVSQPPPRPFTIEELREASSKMKLGKAPGEDGVPAVVIKIICEEKPQMLLDPLNKILNDQIFPNEWKIARLVLVRKTGKPLDEDSPKSYRPLCLINTIAKLYEHLIRCRLVDEMDQGPEKSLALNQYGFRKGRSTIQAARRVIEIRNQARLHGAGEKWCVLVTLDVRNAFNSASWAYIIRELEKRDFTRPIINIIDDYFRHRLLIIEGTKKKKLTAGIPQGSVIGPTLWNLFYDPVLRLDYEDGVEAVGFADDLALVVTSKSRSDLIDKTETAIKLVMLWMQRNNLEIAPEKSEAVILSGRRDRRNIKFQIGQIYIEPVKSTKYLGIHIGENGHFGKHVTAATNKAAERLQKLSCLMANMGGPLFEKRLLLCNVVHSIILYGAPIWGDIARIRKYQNMLASTQRKVLLRVICAYRTVSSTAVQALAGVPPVEELIRERKEMDEASDQTVQERKSAARRETILRWQTKWTQNDSRNALWTKRMIPNLTSWVACTHKSMEYFLTQALTGHGSFRTYTKRLGKTNDRCIYCDGDVIDDPEHTLFVCPRWHEQRTRAEIEIGTDLTVSNLVEHMISTKVKWNIIHQMIKTIMKQKEVEERLWVEPRE